MTTYPFPMFYLAVAIVVALFIAGIVFLVNSPKPSASDCSKLADSESDRNNICPAGQHISLQPGLKTYLKNPQSCCVKDEDGKCSKGREDGSADLCLKYKSESDCVFWNPGDYWCSWTPNYPQPQPQPQPQVPSAKETCLASANAASSGGTCPDAEITCKKYTKGDCKKNNNCCKWTRRPMCCGPDPYCAVSATWPDSLRKDTCNFLKTQFGCYWAENGICSQQATN